MLELSQRKVDVKVIRE